MSVLLRGWGRIFGGSPYICTRRSPKRRNWGGMEGLGGTGDGKRAWEMPEIEGGVPGVWGRSELGWEGSDFLGNTLKFAPRGPPGGRIEREKGGKRGEKRVWGCSEIQKGVRVFGEFGNSGGS